MSYNQFIKNSASDIFDRIDKYQNGGVTMIAHIKFKEGSYELEKSSESLLNEIGRKLMDVESEIYEKTGEQIHILLRAYTDNIGDYDDNLRLSRNRARRVANFLKNEFYFSLSKMEIEGCGENDPLFSNDTPQGREQNRRVEIILTKKKIIREVM
jgi:outer membrane protein OmpA-like peptidoglycan-associated protein